MEFNKRLQELRRARGLTQEELAKELYVSRTAVSKWEQGRGYPNIDSLRAIASFFSVTLDELMSSNEALTIAQVDSKQREGYFRGLIFGLLDISVIMLLFLPLFKEGANGVISAVSLLDLKAINPYLMFFYYAIVIAAAAFGVLTLALQECTTVLWVKIKESLSLILSSAAVLLFIISSQPYAATFLFVYLSIKALMLIKRQ